MRIKFLKDYGLKEGQGVGPHYKAGQEQNFTDPVGLGYARAYIERGLAVEVKIATPVPPPVVKRPEAKIVESVKVEPKDAAKPETKEVAKPA